MVAGFATKEINMVLEKRGDQGHVDILFEIADSLVRNKPSST
jgi:hypothetical protein